jgi:1,4-alpha-glucan branching enzyme
VGSRLNYLNEEVPHVVDQELELVAAGRHSDPHRVLGRHGDVVRVFQPEAREVRLVLGVGANQKKTTMRRVHPAGIFEAGIAPSDGGYQLEAVYEHNGAVSTHRFDDAYRSWPAPGEVDLYLFGQGNHRRLWEVLGAHPRVHDGMVGVSFAVWAPNANSVRVVGDWNFWDGRVHPMRSLGTSGVWELFVPGVTAGDRYKYELVTVDERLILKTDPMALAYEVPPATASVVVDPTKHEWGDSAWMEQRASSDILRLPMSIYEMHLGSWHTTYAGDGESRRPLTYLELAERLPLYLRELGFTHVEFLPVAEHPFSGSWGYQVTGYYAPTSRYGSPDDFRVLVDSLHQAGIGVIIDWVPAHFPKDSFALARFDGSALYEHADPLLGEHPDWGTLIFNYGRNEVRNFLVANALYWCDQFHIDGLRVDAVASMLYLDYSRRPGQWIPNRYGGRENLEAVSFLKEVNELVFGLYPGATVIAEESTAWPGVSRPTYLGGLGFGFKWNMGWMHDTLEYFHHDPIHRRYHHHEVTFSLIYAWTENFILPLSHDEVVHGKGSLLNKMPGDRRQQLANLRALYAWMWAHPGKQLLFMGSELGPEREWNDQAELDWWILDQWEDHRRLKEMLCALNRLYRAYPAFWEEDFRSEGFEWIDADDSDQSVLSFLRRRRGQSDDGVVACVANLTPVIRYDYRLGLPVPGRWFEILNTDATEWGGGGVGNLGSVHAEDIPWHGRSWSARMTLAPLGVLWLTPDQPGGERAQK